MNGGGDIDRFGIHFEQTYLAIFGTLAYWYASYYLDWDDLVAMIISAIDGTLGLCIGFSFRDDCGKDQVPKRGKTLETNDASKTNLNGNENLFLRTEAA